MGGGGGRDGVGGWGGGGGEEESGRGWDEVDRKKNQIRNVGFILV